MTHKKPAKKYRIAELIGDLAINPIELKRELREHFGMAESTFKYKLHAREDQPHEFNTAQLLFIAEKLNVPVSDLYAQNEVAA